MFAEVVRTNRQRLGLTQEELATTAGLGVRTIRKIEAGLVDTPRPVTVRLLADAFGLAGAARERFCQAASDRLTGSSLTARAEARPRVCALLAGAGNQRHNQRSPASFHTTVHAACRDLDADAVCDVWLVGIEAVAQCVQLLYRHQQREPASDVQVRAIVAAVFGDREYGADWVPDPVRCAEISGRTGAQPPELAQ